MRFALHARTTLHTNVAADVVAAQEAGYDGIELWIPKLSRYLDVGFSTTQLKKQLGALQVVMLDALLPFETAHPQRRAELLQTCDRMSAVAHELECPAIQVVALDELHSSDWADQREQLVTSLAELADIAAPRGVRLAIEPVVFSRFCTLPQCVEVVREVGSARAGICLDTWHLWATSTPPLEVAALDPELILAVQVSDTFGKTNNEWRDEDRAAFPGDGVIPLEDYVHAIASTGYRGMWSAEMLSPLHWEWEPRQLAADLLRSLQRLVAGR